ncbi:MAG: hypothetical protein HGA25_02070 [Clostridiales bacterium]|nr:hypothetical protein [Clostridiales bacterium]
MPETEVTKIEQVLEKNKMIQALESLTSLTFTAPKREFRVQLPTNGYFTQPDLDQEELSIPETLGELPTVAPISELSVPVPTNEDNITFDELCALKVALSQSKLVEDDFSILFSPKILAKFNISSGSFELGVSWHQHNYAYKYSPKTGIMFILCENMNKESDKTLGKPITDKICSFLWCMRHTLSYFLVSFPNLLHS